MQAPQQKQATKTYQILQHTYLTLTKNQQPISIHQIPLPFIANSIFNIKTNPHTISHQTATLLQSLKQQQQQPQTPQQPIEDEEILAVVQDDDIFDIGERQQNSQVVKIGLKKGMKSLANVSSYLMTNFIGKKK